MKDKAKGASLEEVHLALAGNPNSGKTSLFNHMTGARQKVGNWGGVTVEIKEGKAVHNGHLLKIIDLPGTYSLTAYSLEEIVARDYILNGNPQVVIDVIDSTNLERNMYLAVQLLEMERPLVFAFNMSDELKKKGIKINIDKLGKLLGVPIVPTVGRSGGGIQDLLGSAVRVAEGRSSTSRPVRIIYGNEIEEEIEKILDLIEAPCNSIHVPARWLAIKLLENDPEAVKIAESSGNAAALVQQVETSGKHLEDIFGEDITTVISEQRYGFIHGALHEAVDYEVIEKTHSSDDIDRFVTHPFFAYLIFIAMMWLLFQATFKLGAYPVHWIEFSFAWLGDTVRTVMPPGDFQSLLVDGVISGVGAVAAFLPNILILFLGISLLEDVGYMARAAFIMDKIMHKMGLHGKSFIPLLMGIGCSVPAIMAARTLNSRADRIITVLITPLISCSARLPIYVLFAGAFFPGHAGNIIFLMYVLSFSFAFLVGILFRKTLFRQEAFPFVMELPPYRIPTIRSVLIHMWEKGKHYVQKMGGVVLVFSILLWFLGAYPKNTFTGMQGDSERIETISRQQEPGALAHTYIGRFGRSIEPVFRPLGFDWKMSVSLITGFVAKEIVVSSMGVLYNAGQEETEISEESTALRHALKANYSPLQGFAFLLFVLLYTPCLVALLTMVRELKSVKWSVFGVSYQVMLAWIVAFVTYQGGLLLGLG